MFRDNSALNVPCDRHAETQHIAAARWFARAAGAALLAEEERVISARLSDRFGYHLLQVGTLPGADFLADSRILHRVVIRLHGEDPQPKYPWVRAEASRLPVESDSVDVMVLPHVLEFEPQAPQALREAARVLVPEGHLIVSGFNPWSLFGLWRIARRHSGNAPWSGQFLAQSRLCDWFELVGLEMTQADLCFFRPPLRSAQGLRRLDALEGVGRSLWPALCGAFVLTARKRVIGATALRPRFAMPRKVGGVSLASPPARIRNE